jgi:hypothetical protein
MPDRPAICPRHYMHTVALGGRTLALATGNIKLALCGLSLNAWAQAQYDLSSPVAQHALEIMARINRLPEELQIRALAMIFGEDPDELAGAAVFAPAKPAYHSSGIHGFTERGTPGDYDTAAGSVIGYRCWTVSHNNALQGAYHGSWPAAVAGFKHTAICYSQCLDEQVPNESDCGCGFWAYWLPSDAISGTYSEPVIGVIEGSGKVILGERGFRSRYAVIRALAVSNKLSPALMPFSDLISDQLSAYGVPVYDDVSELLFAMGTDPVYSPDVRAMINFTGTSSKDLDSYCLLLNSTAAVAKRCTQSLTSDNAKRWAVDAKFHDASLASAEQLVISKVLAARQQPNMVT